MPPVPTVFCSKEEGPELLARARNLRPPSARPSKASSTVCAVTYQTSQLNTRRAVRSQPHSQPRQAVPSARTRCWPRSASISTTDAAPPMSRRRSPVSSARSRQRSPKSPASLSRPRTATPRARRKRRCSLAAETTWFGVAHATNLHHSRAHPPGVEQRARANRSDGRYWRRAAGAPGAAKRRVLHRSCRSKSAG